MRAEPSPLMERIGQRMRDRRKELGLSLEKLAERTELSKAGLHQVEQGTSEPMASTVVRICAALRLSADDLLGMENL